MIEGALVKPASGKILSMLGDYFGVPRRKLFGIPIEQDYFYRKRLLKAIWKPVK